MRIALVAAALACIAGILSQYAPGVFDRVVFNRQHGRTARHLPAQLPAVDGFVAVLDCRDIGSTRILRYGGRDYIVLVADCAGDRRARRWLTTGGVIGEIDYDLARRLAIVGRGVPAELCKEIKQ